MSRADITGHEEVAMRVLQGFCANPAIFATTPGQGWDLVNCTYAQLVEVAFQIADEMICHQRQVDPAQAVRQQTDSVGGGQST